MTHTDDPAAFAGFEPGAELSSQQITAKARELLAQLTLDEKSGHSLGTDRGLPRRRL